jgi:hypothetical protein
MDKDADIVELLIRSAGRRAEPPGDAYRQVLAAATAAFHAQAARRLQRRWALGAGIAASLVLARAGRERRSARDRRAHGRRCRAARGRGLAAARGRPGIARHRP